MCMGLYITGRLFISCSSWDHKRLRPLCCTSKTTKPFHDSSSIKVYSSFYFLLIFVSFFTSLVLHVWFNHDFWSHVWCHLQWKSLRSHRSKRGNFKLTIYILCVLIYLVKNFLPILIFSLFFKKKQTMWFAQIFCIAGWLAIAFAKDTIWLDAGRFSTGFAVGLFSYVVIIFLLISLLIFFLLV